MTQSSAGMRSADIATTTSAMTSTAPSARMTALRTAAGAGCSRRSSSHCSTTATMPATPIMIAAFVSACVIHGTAP